MPPTMTNDAPSGQETGGRTDIEITVCSNGVVNVHRPESDRAHSVFVGADGGVVRCSCKGHHFRGECSHADAIAARPLVTASAQAAASTTPTVATDGGRVETAETEPEADTESDLPAIEETGDHTMRCTGCGRDGPKGLDGEPVILHERDCPRDDADRSAERHGGDGLRKTADELADEQSERGGDTETEGDTERDEPRGVVDPYADRVAEREQVDETPL